ncbi:MAG: hypothetical protein AAB393_09370, partial [Bacteroidota bacterium]
MKKVVLAFGLFLLMARVCPAPIFRPYPGLDGLIEESDAIAVVRLMKEKTTSYFGEPTVFDAHF